MVLGVDKKRIIFIASLSIALAAVFAPSMNFDGAGSHAANTEATKTITITKQWIGDTVSSRPDDITVYLNKTVSTLLPGCQTATTNCPGGSANTLEAKMKALAGSGGLNSNNTTITAIRKATEAQYNAVKSTLTSANEVQASGEKTYMWFAGGTIFFYSEADNIYLSPNSSGLFRKLTNLTDASGLAYFNTTYVTDMNRMFQDTPNISDISPLSNWDVGNVIDMTFMFGSNWTSTGGCSPSMNFSNLTALSNWNVSNVKSMYQMFKCNVSLSNISPLSNWDVSNVTNMAQMFNRSAVSDTSPIQNWNVVNVNRTISGNSDGFMQMFNNTPIVSSYSSWPVFSKRTGSWNNTGSYIPTGNPAGAVTVTTKTPSADQQICTGNAWDKSQNNDGIWTCSLTVSNDDSIYKAWEDEVDDYDGSAYAESPITVENDSVSIINIGLSTNNYAINLRKIVSGDAGDTNKYFDFQVNAYDENGNIVPAYSRSLRLKHNESATVLVFTIPQEYSYEIVETSTEYAAYNDVVKTVDGEVVKAQSAGTSTGVITPTESQTVTFTNIKTNSPTKTITIFKHWESDISADRPNTITAYLNKTTAELIDGPSLNSRMKTLANGGSYVSYTTQDTKIIALNMATKAQYDAVSGSLTSLNEVQTSGSANKIYMWNDNGVIYFYSPADNIYMNANSSWAFSYLTNVTDISALANFNTTYVTNMNKMFLDSWKITSLTSLESWDVSNVTDMSYMFSATWYSSGYTAMNISDLSPLSGWNTQKVTTMDSMFKCAGSILDLDALSNWNVQNLTNMTQMFNRATSLLDTEGIKGWNVTRVANNGFNMALANIPSTTVRHDFTVREGSWNTSGTYTPTAGPNTVPASTITKTKSADQQTCTTWDKSQDSVGIWTCTLTVSNDASVYKAWEDEIYGYEESALAANPTNVSSDTATITNKREGYTITYKKIVTGDLADLTQTFDFNIKVYDTNGNERSEYEKTETLRHNRIKSMVIPAGYYYQITENTSAYDNFYRIVDSNDNSVIVDTTASSTTGMVLPAGDQTVTFTNNKTGTPLTGRFHNLWPFSIMISAAVGFMVARISYLLFLRRRIRRGV